MGDEQLGFSWDNRPAEQMILDLPSSTQPGRDDVILTASNEQAAAWLDAWPAWTSSLAVLSGPAGSGKSHLARTWASRVGARALDARDLIDVTLGDEPFLVEDVDRGALDERGLFHLVNAARSNGLTGVLTTRFPPGVWRTPLADLNSRLMAATQLSIAQPDDALVAGVAFKLLAERQLTVEAPVIDHIVARVDRSLSSVASLVKRLDYLALTRAKPITRALVQDALRMESGA